MSYSPESHNKKSTTDDPVRVIVADDDEHLCKVLARDLQNRGYECVTKSDGAAALQALGSTTFDIALLDLDMPIVDGFHVLTTMQQDHPDTIPIVLTGYSDIARAVKAMKLGAFDFLEKPCNPHLLESVIRRATEYRRAKRHARKMEEEAVEFQSALKQERTFGQAQKLESVGRLAAGIAHEINTPTQYIGDNIEFLQIAYENIVHLLGVLCRMRDSAKDSSVMPALLSEAKDLAEKTNLEYLMEQIPRAIEQSLEGVRRIASIVQAMKEFSHPGPAEKTLADLNQCIRSTVTVSRSEWKYVADLITDLDGGLPLVCCLPSELNQVFLNLIVNAAHAIGDVVGENSVCKGNIAISTRQDGEWAEIRIADTGFGIPEEIQDRIFDPFFTTKEVGRGTGQGLAIAHSVVVDKHGGTITFESKVGIGTTFIIRLPIEIPSGGEVQTE